MNVAEVARQLRISPEKLRCKLLSNNTLGKCFTESGGSGRHRELLIPLDEFLYLYNNQVVLNGKWTPSQLNCYMNKTSPSGCSQCSVYPIMGKKCKMFDSVMKNIRKYGEPNIKGVNYE